MPWVGSRPSRVPKTLSASARWTLATCARGVPSFRRGQGRPVSADGPPHQLTHAPNRLSSSTRSTPGAIDRVVRTLACDTYRDNVGSGSGWPAIHPRTRRRGPCATTSAPAEEGALFATGVEDVLPPPGPRGWERPFRATCTSIPRRAAICLDQRIPRGVLPWSANRDRSCAAFCWNRLREPASSLIRAAPPLVTAVRRQGPWWPGDAAEQTPGRGLSAVTIQSSLPAPGAGRRWSAGHCERPRRTIQSPETHNGVSGLLPAVRQGPILTTPPLAGLS